MRTNLQFSSRSVHIYKKNIYWKTCKGKLVATILQIEPLFGFQMLQMSHQMASVVASVEIKEISLNRILINVGYLQISGQLYLKY